MLRNIFYETSHDCLEYICGYAHVKLYFIQWKFTYVIGKFSRVSLFLGHSVYYLTQWNSQPTNFTMLQLLSYLTPLIYIV